MIVVDSREQLPLTFSQAPTVRKGLATGDYSLAGYENRVAIERKSKSDLYGSLGHGRERFEREVQRLAEMEFGALVIEADLPDLLEAPAHCPRMNPRAVVASVLGWSVKYRLPVFFACDRRHAASVIWHLLEKFARYDAEGRLWSPGRAI